MTALPPGAKRADVPDPDALRDAVVAAARAWRHGKGAWMREHYELRDAVDAYEAALPPGAA